MMESLTKWEARLFGLAQHVAGWSKDPSTKVGAVIADPANRVISVGYNGPARFVNDENLSRNSKLRRTVHAEENAILFAQREIELMRLYVTHHPCATCAAKIIQTGLAAVVCPEPDPAFYARWKDDIDEARQMFDEAGVFVKTVG